MSKLNDLTAITTPSLSDLVYCVQNSTDYKVTNEQLLDLIKTNTVIPLTQAQYDALTPAEKNNGSIYIITDASITADDIEYTSGVSVADKIDDIEDNTIYKDGTYNLSGICFGYGSGSSGNPNGIFYLPKIIPANKTVTITNPSITLCRKYDGSNVAQTTAIASYSGSQNYVAIGGNVAVGYYVSCIMSVAFTMTIS